MRDWQKIIRCTIPYRTVCSSDWKMKKCFWDQTTLKIEQTFTGLLHQGLLCSSKKFSGYRHSSHQLQQVRLRERQCLYKKKHRTLPPPKHT